METEPAWQQSNVTTATAAAAVRDRVTDALMLIDEGLTTSNTLSLWRGRAELASLLQELPTHGL